jgi:rsbT antagonist protein RsbS
MAFHVDIPRIAIQFARNVVIASIQIDLSDDVLDQFREDLLARVHETSCRGVIVDVSGLDTIDSEEFAALRRIMTMTNLMGSRSILLGLRPGVVSALIEAGAEVDGLDAAIDLDGAFEMLESHAEIDADAEADAEADADTDAGADAVTEGVQLPGCDEIPVVES